MFDLFISQFLLGHHRDMDQVIYGLDLGGFEAGLFELFLIKFQCGVLG